MLAGAFLPRAAERGPDLPQVGIGYDFSGLGAVTETRPTPVPDPLTTETNPLYVRIEILWAEAEKTRAEFNWTAADAVVDRFRSRKHEPVLDLWGGNPLYSEDILRPPSASESAALEAWQRFVREAVKHFHGRVRYYQIGKTPNAGAIWGGLDSAKSYAFLLKKSAVIVRAEAKGAVVVAGGLAGADASWLARLFAEGTAPYVDVISLRPDARKDIGEQCDAVLKIVRERDASDGLWVEAVGVSGSGEDAGTDIVKKLLTAFDHGAGAAFFALPYPEAGLPSGGEFLARSHSALSAEMGRVPAAERVAFADAAGAALQGITAVSFYDPAKAISLTGYWAAASAVPPTATMHLLARRPGPPTLYDPVTGKTTAVTFEREPNGAKGVVPVSASPLLLVFREGAAGGAEIADTSESLQVSAERGITAEEVIAKYREFEAAQDARLSRYSSDAMINFHFRIGGSSRTVDVGMGGSYFNDPKAGAEWELRDYYLNGNKSRWKEFPELPLVQPEKVLTLPLDITFDRSYTYEYAGEETIEGRACYLLAFAPVDPSMTLYRGKVWIDKANWARVRVASVQTRMEPPFLSSEEQATYAPVKNAAGEEFWVVTKIDGQQIYSAGGRNFIVLRDIVFSNFRINDPDFATRREMAHESAHQMLKDTDQGLRYMVKDEAGQRVVKKEFDTNQLFGLAGVIKDPSLSTPIPLLGINYFDYDFMKKGIQTNLFFAGALTSFNLTDPNFLGTGFDLGTDLFLSALRREDKDHAGGSFDLPSFPLPEGGGVSAETVETGEEVDERNIERREQSLSVNLGREIGNFVKLKAAYELGYQAYQRAEDTDRRYIVPRDTLVHTSTLLGTFSRKGYEVHASASYSVRQRFEFWGDPCQQGADSRPGARTYFNPSLPKFCRPGLESDPSRRERQRRRMLLLAGDDFDPKATGYSQFLAGASKEFFLPSFQKLRFGADLYQGTDLDRFSRYAFDRFGAPVRGFAGSGIRFDSGAILRAAYVFNVANLIRFEALVDQARVKTYGSATAKTNHTGLGLSASVLGPWKTIWQLDYGYALKSDVKSVEGDQELLLVVLKLF